jgi:hypothetical protein
LTAGQRVPGILTTEAAMKKEQALKHWAALPANQPVKPAVVPYKHKGSTYGQDGIRITGSPAFIDSVLSRLKELLAHENAETRLQLSYAEATDKETGAKTGSYSCYVQVHERGGEAQMVNAYASALCGRDVVLSRGF